MSRFCFDSSLTMNMALEQAICIHARGVKKQVRHRIKICRTCFSGILRWRFNALLIGDKCQSGKVDKSQLTRRKAQCLLHRGKEDIARIRTTTSKIAQRAEVRFVMAAICRWLKRRGVKRDKTLVVPDTVVAESCEPLGPAFTR